MLYLVMYGGYMVRTSRDHTYYMARSSGVTSVNNYDRSFNVIQCILCDIKYYGAGWVRIPFIMYQAYGGAIHYE